MRRLIVREWKHLSVWCHNGLSGKAAWALRRVYHCAFYQLSFTVWMEAAAELERLWSFYFAWQWARLMSAHEVCFPALYYSDSNYHKSNTVKKKEKKINQMQSNTYWCLVAPLFPEGLLMPHSFRCCLRVHNSTPQQQQLHVYLVYWPVTFILTCLSLHL